MASSINASTSGAGGVITSADNSGILNLQSGGNTIATVQSTGFSLPASATISAANTFGFKNRIINGGMVIDQRNAGAAVTVNSNTGTQYCVDRFVIQGTSSAGVFTDQQLSTTPPANFSYYSHITVTTADASPAAAALYTIAQIIEGNNIQDLGFGTANAKSVSVSFWVRSSLTGTFGASLRNGTSFNYSYPFQYTISAANTWTYITITIAGPTSGTWASGSGGGLVLTFDLGCGSNLTSASANTWQSGNYNSVTGSTRVMATNAATWDITGVQLEVGSQATSFDFRDYGRELILCQRYYEIVSNIAIAVTYNQSDNVRFYVPFKVAKRTTPSVTTPNGGNSESGIAWTPGFGSVDNYGAFCAAAITIQVRSYINAPTLASAEL